MKRNARCGVPTRPRLQTYPRPMNGMRNARCGVPIRLKPFAIFQKLDVRVACWNHEMPILAIEEGGTVRPADNPSAVALELEFSDRECLDRSPRRVTSLRLPPLSAARPEDHCAG